MFKVGDYITDKGRAGEFVYLILAEEPKASSQLHPYYTIRLVKSGKSILKNGSVYKHITLLNSDWTITEEPTHLTSIISKIKYLDKRKTLDKSRIVPPKGVYRGSHKVSEVQAPDSTRTTGNQSPVHTYGLDVATISALLDGLGVDMARVPRTDSN